MLKICAFCGEEKEETAFAWAIAPVNRRVKLGLREPIRKACCRLCVNALSAEKRRLNEKKHAVRRYASQLLRRHAHPEKHRATNRRSYGRHRATILKTCRRYRQTNPVKVRTAVRQAQRNHPERVSAQSRLHNALKRGASHGERVRHIDIAERDNWMCHICGKRVTRKTWSLDHLMPVSRGGAHTRINVALAHRDCNSRRGADRLPAQLRLIE